MKTPSWIALMLSIWRAVLARAGCAGPSDPGDLIAQITASPYSRLVRPNDGGAPTDVAVQLFVESLNAVNEKANSVSMSGYWRMAWTDPRLNFTGSGDGGCFDKLNLEIDRMVPLKSPVVWVPDLYFMSSLEEKYGSYLFEVYPSGEGYVSIRFNHVLSCMMDFTQMPFDTQVCSIGILSYSEDASKVQLAAKDGIGIQLADGGAHIPSWTIHDTATTFHMSQYGTGDHILQWHSMLIDVTIKRLSGYHIMNDVLYGVLFVLMSWTGFFVNRSNAPARVTLSLLPVLTMLNHITGIQRQLPRISDLTWLSIFLLVSLVYNITAVLEYGVVSWLLSVEETRAARLRTLRVLSTQLGEAYVTQTISRQASRRLSQQSSRSPNDLQDDDEDVDRAELGRSGSSLSALDVSMLLPEQQRMVHDSLKLFDPRSDGFVSAKGLRSGLRSFNIYYTAEQVSEIFRKMGVDEHDSMPRDQFIKYLKSMPEPSPTMHGEFVDQPPSLVLDRIMRYVFLLTYITTLVAIFTLVGKIGNAS